MKRKLQQIEKLSHRRRIGGRVRLLCALLLLAVIATACDVHEFPEQAQPAGETEVILHLDYSRELPPYKDIIYTPGESRADNPSELYDFRYIVRVYARENVRGYSQTPCKEVRFSKDEVSILNRDVHLMLEPGEYKFLVWSDYSLQGSADDRYYDTGDFTQVTLTGEYVGNDDFRDAFRGELDGTVTAHATNEYGVQMVRPMGKYRFIATDFDRFLTRAEEASRAEWEATRAEDPLHAPAEAPPVNINDYTVLVRYPGFMPHVFNMFTNRPADAKTGVSFKSRILRLSDQEAELGFDYVFINGHEAPYTVCVELYDKKGNLIGSSGAIDVPLMRSMLTTVKGEFLTSKAQGGVGVNPDFDGEFNIFVP